MVVIILQYTYITKYYKVVAGLIKTHSSKLCRMGDHDHELFTQTTNSNRTLMQYQILKIVIFNITMDCKSTFSLLYTIANLMLLEFCIQCTVAMLEILSNITTQTCCPLCGHKKLNKLDDSNFKQVDNSLFKNQALISYIQDVKDCHVNRDSSLRNA